MALLLGTGVAAIAPAAQAQSSGLVAAKVTGSIKVDGILNEGFWANANSYTVALNPSNQFGGKESSVNVKLAENGTWLFIAAQWQDSSQSRMEASVLQGSSTGQYVYNSTYYYGDLFYAMFYMGSGTPGMSPYAQSSAGRGGAPQGWSAGNAESVWNWRSYYTDQGANDFPHYIPYGSVSPEVYSYGPNKGQVITFPHSWAWDFYANSTGNWLIDDGMLHSAGCAVQGNPFDVWAAATWSNGVWTLEMARAFAPSGANTNYSITLQQGETYSIAFAVANGNLGEVDATDSISGWNTLQIPAPSTSTPTLYYALAAVAVVVIVAIAVVGIRRRPQGRTAVPSPA